MPKDPEQDLERKGLEIAFMNAMASASNEDDRPEAAIVLEVSKRIQALGSPPPSATDVVGWLHGDKPPPDHVTEAAVRSVVLVGWRAEVLFIHDGAKEALLTLAAPPPDQVASSRPRPRYGYRLREDGRSIEPDADEQRVISLVWYMRRMGASINKLSHVLNRREGLRNRKGEPFWPEQIVELTMLIPADELRKLN